MTIVQFTVLFQLKYSVDVMCVCDIYIYSYTVMLESPKYSNQSYKNVDTLIVS